MKALDRLLSMSAFYGLIALRKHREDHPNIGLCEAVDVVKRLSTNDAHHDYEAALLLQEIVPPACSIASPSLFFREVIWSVIRHSPPWWRRFAPYGREKLRNALQSNEAQCFTSAGLFVEMPTPDVLAWWDLLAQSVRASDNDRRLEQGREAEQLTIEYERARLKSLGIELDPRWVSVDDNTVGYDIQSFDAGVVEPIVKLIEVKSCARDTAAIFLTRNEWETAISRSPNYRFHVWLLPEKKLIELRPDEIEPHVPVNRGSGSWENAKISLR